MGQGGGVRERTGWLCAPGLPQLYKSMEPKTSTKIQAPELIHVSVSKADKEHIP